MERLFCERPMLGVKVIDKRVTNQQAEMINWT